MDATLDGLAEEVSRLTGGGEVGPLPAGPYADHVLDGQPMERLARVVRSGELEVVLFSIPPDWRSGRKEGSRQLSVAEQAKEISRAVSMLLMDALPRRDWGRVALIRLESGRSSPDVLASVIANDPATVMKYAYPEGRPLADVAARIPVLAPLWTAREPLEPRWLGRIRAPGGLGPLSEVDVELRAGPGLTSFHGGGGTGKSLLLRGIGMALRGEGPLEAELPDGLPSMPGAPPDEAMRPWRRMIGYGAPSGEMLLPPELEGGGAMAAERVGRGLVAAATAGARPGEWPGVIVDNPTTGLDDIRRVKALEAMVRLAADRQVVTAVRDRLEHALLERIARERGVPFDAVDLREGRALLRPMAPAPVR